MDGGPAAMIARIYRPTRTAMQSGTAKTTRWLLEYEPERPREVEPLMGWTSSGDMRQQLKLWFDSKVEAVAYATKNGIAYRIEEPKDAKRRIMSYSDNFKFNRVGQWTH
jgi:hypothetical protein